VCVCVCVCVVSHVCVHAHLYRVGGCCLLLGRSMSCMHIMCVMYVSGRWLPGCLAINVMCEWADCSVCVGVNGKRRERGAGYEVELGIERDRTLPLHHKAQSGERLKHKREWPTRS